MGAQEEQGPCHQTSTNRPELHRGLLSSSVSVSCLQQAWWEAGQSPGGTALVPSVRLQQKPLHMPDPMCMQSHLRIAQVRHTQGLCSHLVKVLLHRCRCEVLARTREGYTVRTSKGPPPQLGSHSGDRRLFTRWPALLPVSLSWASREEDRVRSTF